MTVLVTTPDFRAWLAERGYDPPRDPATAFGLVALYEATRAAERETGRPLSAAAVRHP